MKNEKIITEILKNLMYRHGKIGEKKHGKYLHIFSKDKKKMLKMDTYNGCIAFGLIGEKIIKRYDKYQKQFLYGDNEFTGVRILPKFYINTKYKIEENSLKQMINSYKFILQNT